MIVDLRRGSPTYGEWEGFELTDENITSLYCPVGFAHGFCVLSDIADVLYKQTDYYAPARARFAYDDPDVGVAWPLPAEELKPSERDATAPSSADSRRAAPAPFEYSACGGARRPFPPGRRSGPRSQRRGRPGRGRVADVQRPLGGREDEVVDEPAVAGDRLGADAGEGGPTSGGAELGHVAGGGTRRRRGARRVARISRRPVRHQRRNIRQEPGQAQGAPPQSR